VLDGRCVEFVRQGLEHFFAGNAVIVKDTDFDQSMGVEGGIDLFFDVGGQAIATDHDDGVEVVGFGAVFLALGRSQLNLGHVGIIGAMSIQSKTAKPEQKPDNRAGKKADNKAGNKKVNKAWLHDHINDPYVKLATKEGYRARAAYKLKEIDETLHLIKPGALVVDLGSTPGAWSQYVRRRLSPGGAMALPAVVQAGEVDRRRLPLAEASRHLLARHTGQLFQSCHACQNLANTVCPHGTYALFHRSPAHAFGRKLLDDGFLDGGSHGQ